MPHLHPRAAGLHGVRFVPYLQWEFSAAVLRASPHVGSRGETWGTGTRISTRTRTRTGTRIGIGTRTEIRTGTGTRSRTRTGMRTSTETRIRARIRIWTGTRTEIRRRRQNGVENGDF